MSPLSALCLVVVVSTVSANSGGDLQKLATANNEFAFSLYSRLASENKENIFFSPLSLSTAFGMLYHGARGQTAQELRRVLGYEAAGLSDAEVGASFLRLTSDLGQATGPDTYTLDMATALLVDQGLALAPNYKEEVKRLYKAQVREVNFSRDQKWIVDGVNEWVKTNTRNKISKLLDTVDPNTVALLLNAVYFKGEWKSQFKHTNTFDRDFYNFGQESQAKQVPMMYQMSDFPYTTIPGAQVLELPYKGNASMLVFLPNAKDGLQELSRSLNAQVLSSVMKNLRKRKVKVFLPKFKAEYSKDLKGELQALGAGRLFGNQADLSGMTTGQSSLKVSRVVHKARVEVDEEGSVAAAVTQIDIVLFSLNTEIDLAKEFNVDHPFLYAIVDKDLGGLVFMGDVVKL